MPVRQLRRIGPVAGQSLHDRMQANPLHVVYWRRWMDALERKHRDLVIDDGENILAAEGHGERKLLYSFDSDRAFADRFPPMFEQLLPRLRQKLGDGSLRLRLSYFPARPMVEPVLKRLSFAPVRDWFEFTLDRATKLPAAPAPRGAVPRRRPRRRRRWCASIANASPIPAAPERMRASIKQGEQVLVAERGAIVDTALLHPTRARDSSTVAVAEARDEGIGAALTTRACKRLVADGARADVVDHRPRQRIRHSGSTGAWVNRPRWPRLHPPDGPCRGRSAPDREARHADPLRRLAIARHPCRRPRPASAATGPGSRTTGCASSPVWTTRRSRRSRSPAPFAPWSAALH
jgi:hypothetical protein